MPVANHSEAGRGDPIVKMLVSTTLFHPRQTRKGAQCSKYRNCPLRRDTRLKDGVQVQFPVSYTLPRTPIIQYSTTSFSTAKPTREQSIQPLQTDNLSKILEKQNQLTSLNNSRCCILCPKEILLSLVLSPTLGERVVDQNKII